MKELNLIKVIQNTLTKSSYIGDDCAYLKDLGIVMTQDSLIEDVHFSLKFATPYQIAYKSIIVNLSDIFASGAIPKYITISISLPPNIDEKFVSEFYTAIEYLSKKFDFEVVGGDITGSDKVFISICAIGLIKGRRISSRSDAQVGDYVIVSGEHGASAAGLWLLQNSSIQPELTSKEGLINSHLIPSIQPKFSSEIATKVNRNYAMMDSSDGLMDSLFKIAHSSNKLISVDFRKIPYNKNIEKVAKLANIDFKDWIFYGGEDYKLIACIDEKNLKKIDANYTIIGKVEKKKSNHFVNVTFEDAIQKITNLDKTFNHFGEKL